VLDSHGGLTVDAVTTLSGSDLYDLLMSKGFEYDASYGEYVCYYEPFQAFAVSVDGSTVLDESGMRSLSVGGAGDPVVYVIAAYDYGDDLNGAYDAIVGDSASDKLVLDEETIVAKVENEGGKYFVMAMNSEGDLGPTFAVVSEEAISSGVFYTWTGLDTSFGSTVDELYGSFTSQA
jgi:hypothetical protein